VGKNKKKIKLSILGSRVDGIIRFNVNNISENILLKGVPKTRTIVFLRWSPSQAT
jgi:hypothetical protein